MAVQPPLGGCVLKPAAKTTAANLDSQPPLGGCVLKPPLPKRPAIAITSRL